MTHRTPEQFRVEDSLAQNRRFVVRSAREKLGFTIGVESVSPIDQRLNLGKFDLQAHQPVINAADSLEKANNAAFDGATITSQIAEPADVTRGPEYA